MRSVTRRAHAKLNAFLRVLGRVRTGSTTSRPRSCRSSSHDVVTVEQARRPRGRGDGRARRGAGASGRRVPRSGARRTRWSSAVGGRAPRARITIEKRIPVAAGLGGGSADAAATILALDELCGRGLDAEPCWIGDGGRLRRAARSCTAAPCSPTAGASIVTPLHARTTHWVVVRSRSPCGRRTPTPGGMSDAAVGPGPRRADRGDRGRRSRRSARRSSTISQPVVAASAPGGRRRVARLRDAGALGAVMTGSGPTVVAPRARPRPTPTAIASAVPGSFVTTASPPASPRYDGARRPGSSNGKTRAFGA